MVYGDILYFIQGGVIMTKEERVLKYVNILNNDTNVCGIRFG